MVPCNLLVSRPVSLNSQMRLSLLPFQQQAKRFLSGNNAAPINVAKLKYLATKRGIVENELIFQKFFAPGGGWDKLSASSARDKEIRLLNELLQEYDWDIFAWVSGQKPVPERYRDSEMFKLLSEGLRGQKQKQEQEENSK